MNAEPNSTLKQRLAERFADLALLRILILHPWFRLAFAGVLLILAGLLLGLPRIWVVSPPGFRPILRLNGVDFVQAWSLARTARQLTAEGRYREAALAWRSAVANNPADLRLHREAVRNLLRCEPLDRGLAVPALAQIGWLLRLSNTNRADVELAAGVFDKCGLGSEVFALLHPQRGHLSRNEEGPYLKAAFNVRNMAEFADCWQRGRDRFAENPELAMYHAAYQAGWGPVDAAPDGRHALDQAAASPERWELACRLQLAVFEQTTDVVGYARVLRRLDDALVSRLGDHARYWSLLAVLGRTAEARRLVTTSSPPLIWPWDILQLVSAYQRLDLESEALQVLRRAAPEHGRSGGPWSTAIWLTYCDLLIRDQRWGELADAAARMRASDLIPDEMTGFIELMEGRAQQGLDHRDNAAAAFQRAVTRPFPTPGVALEGALTLKRLGYPGEARDLLLREEASLADDPQYWRAVMEVADALKEDSVWLLKAALRRRQLQPDEPEAEVDYGIALIVNRQSPAEAARITWRLLTTNPTLSDAQVNHSLALLQNQRLVEAEQLLRTIDPAQLYPLGETLYHLAWFELGFRRRDSEQAAAHAAKIDRRHLFPVQTQWLDQALRELRRE